MLCEPGGWVSLPGLLCKGGRARLCGRSVFVLGDAVHCAVAGDVHTRVFGRGYRWRGFAGADLSSFGQYCAPCGVISYRNIGACRLLVMRPVVLGGDTSNDG